MVQPRYKRVSEVTMSAIFLLHEEHVFGGSNPSVPTILNIVGGAVEACNR